VAGRPPTPVGSHGNISIWKSHEDPVVWSAFARIRMANGRSKQVLRRAKTKSAARQKIIDALRELSNAATGGAITSDVRFAKLAEMWLEHLTREYALSNKSPQTPRLYRGYVKNWVLPSLGDLQAREVRAWNVNQVIQAARTKRSYGTAKTLRTVLSAICAFAVRQGAMQTNPVKDTERLASSGGKDVKALTMEQRMDLLERLDEFVESKRVDAAGRSRRRHSQVWFQLPDIVRAMFSTGARLSEILALTGDDVDYRAATVRLGHHIVRRPGHGLERMADRKGGGRQLVLGVPQWSVPMWRLRKIAVPSDGSWSDPNNVMHRIREAMDACGFEWVTSHVWRKTVATVLDEAGLPTTAIADQLGNNPAVVERHYRATRKSNEGNVAALERIIE
jgi:integrase